MVDEGHDQLSIRKQCELLNLNRSNVYYKAMPPRNDSLIANEIHEMWLEMPFYGYRKLTAELNRRSHGVNHKKVLRLMREMNVQALYPRPNTSRHNPNNKIYPYLLRGLEIIYPNQVWSTDITYIKMPEGFMYLVGLIDVYSRYMLSWKFSNTLDTEFCLDMLKEGLGRGKPEILNTDQGCQFTSNAWIECVESNAIKVSMDGRGRWADNVFIERFWRTIKHEHVLLHDYKTAGEARESIKHFIDIYNHKRLHQSLGYKTPAEIYWG